MHARTTYIKPQIYRVNSGGITRETLNEVNQHYHILDSGEFQWIDCDICDKCGFWGECLNTFHQCWGVEQYIKSKTCYLNLTRWLCVTRSGFFFYSKRWLIANRWIRNTDEHRICGSCKQLWIKWCIQQISPVFSSNNRFDNFLTTPSLCSSNYLFWEKKTYLLCVPFVFQTQFVEPDRPNINVLQNNLFSLFIKFLSSIWKREKQWQNFFF